MNIDLRTIPSYLITCGPVAPHFDGFNITTIIAGQRGFQHITDCTYNHFFAVMCGLEGHLPFAVYEEDAWPTEWYLPKLELLPKCDMLKIDLSKLGRHGPDWDWNPEWTENRPDRRFIKVRNMLSSAAYVVMTDVFGRELRTALGDGAEIGTASDCAMIPLMGRYDVLALKKPLFYQGPETNQHADKTNWCIE